MIPHWRRALAAPSPAPRRGRAVDLPRKPRPVPVDAPGVVVLARCPRCRRAVATAGPRPRSFEVACACGNLVTVARSMWGAA